MILEGLVTTLDAEGRLNVAPMGPHVPGDGRDLRRFELRPFRTSTTCRNLARSGEGVFHLVDDAGLLARALLGGDGPDDEPPTRPAAAVRGRILLDACRYVEFRVLGRDDGRGERARFAAEAVASGRLRDFLGWNRAAHAVVEAAILASRVGIVPDLDIIEGLARLSIPVDKTAGPVERAAFDRLVEHVRARIGAASATTAAPPAGAGP